MSGTSQNVPPGSPTASLTSNQQLANAIQGNTAVLNNILAAQQHLSTSATNITPPKMGRLLEEDGKKFFEMGGIPDVGWTTLTEQTARKHAGQFRSLDKPKNSNLFTTMPALNPTWNVKQRLAPLQQHIISVALDYGMEQNCYIKHPNKNEMINLIEHPHIFSGDLPRLTKAWDDQKAHHDRWDSENDGALRTLILNSVDAPLRNKVSGLHDMDDGALVTWIKIVREWSIMT